MSVFEAIDINPAVPPTSAAPAIPARTFQSGDEAFLDECRRHLSPDLVAIGAELVLVSRRLHAGRLVEGQGRKWVNRPSNFVAITIQNYCQAFVVHVKGRPRDFSAPTLHIKLDRGSYSRFKLRNASQLEDAIKVVLASAERDNRR